LVGSFLYAKFSRMLVSYHASWIIGIFWAILSLMADLNGGRFHVKLVNLFLPSWKKKFRSWIF
jgi:hypothetical protein